jgi:single-stranded-DNA-specific exonuclease
MVTINYKLIDGSLNDISNPIKTVLLNRGINDYERYLNLTEDDIETWEHLDNINEAVECFAKHFDNYDTIAILSDVDTDGVCSSTIMYKYIKSMQEDYPVFLVLHKNNKSHGLSSWDFDIPSNTRLLIIPDAGTNDIDECQKLIDDGMSIIILDHHQKSDERINPAIVVNNQTSDSYYNKHACGAHVTYDFMRALDGYYWQEYADDFADIVALADISDVMSLKSESTKAMVNYGLQNIRNKMFKHIIEAQEFSMKGIINPHTVSFYVTPLINSFIRLATFEERQLLIKAFCEDESETFEYTKRGESFPIEESIYEHVVRIAKSYKGKQDRSRDKAVGIILNKAEECRDDKVAIIDATGDIDGALTGLVAIRISEAINKPVLLVREHNGVLGGSGRAFNNCPITDFRGLVEQNPYMDWGTGHNSAFGTQLQYENVELAKQWFNEQLKDVSMDKVYSVDFVININNIDVGFIHQIHEHQGIWAHGVNEPLVAITNIALKRTDIHVQGKNFDSVAFIIDDIKYVQFKMADDNPLLQFATQWGGDENDEIVLDIVGEVSINEYKGIYTPQVMIKAINVI